MVKRVLVVVLILLVVGAFVAVGTAQDDTNPDAVITFPPPVYVVRGSVQILGSANVPGQVNYFIEYQPLNDALVPISGQDDTWFPATLPTRATVDDDVLGEWDTTLAPDGIYALRLTVVTDGRAVFNIVSPVRVENTALNEDTAEDTTLDADASVNNALLALTATAAARSGGTAATPPPLSTLAGTAVLRPTPTDFSGDLTAEVLVIANLRSGDSTLYSIEAGLEPGTVLDVIGRSSRGTNWLLVLTPDGERGWVAPSVVRLRGNILDAPEVEPPLPPVTPTPVPTATPVLPDANVVRVDVDRDLEEDEPFQVVVTIRNDGGQFLPVSQIFCNVEPQDVEVTFSGGGLQPGSQAQFVIPLRVDSGGGRDVTIICVYDPNRNITEARTDNNSNQVTRFLEDD